MFPKGHIMLTQRLFSDTSQCMLIMLIEPQIFLAKKTP